jgi:hypothetical protein
MAAEKISVTVDEELMKWARGAAKRRRTTLSALVSRALELQKQHEARERYLEKALAGMSPAELERQTAEAYRQIFGREDAAE